SESIEGLRMFITAAEKNRLEMMNPPEETPRLFEKLLPYAFALTPLIHGRTDSRTFLPRPITRRPGTGAI
ncbi:MAG: hypothetical protein PHI81_07850, partial [Synergistaceae bacterium]|nr:hypothetical protein [Synergistaceae bacterium]